MYMLLRSSCSMEGLQLVGLNRGLVLVQVSQWVLSSVVVGIVVGIDGLRLEASNGVELLDGSSTEASQGSEDSPLDLSDLSVLHCINQGVLSLRSMILQFFGGIFLSKWSDLVEVHLQVVRHLLSQVLIGGSDRSGKGLAGEAARHGHSSHNLIQGESHLDLLRCN
eukprot:CAMPEP_0206599102 /NCGR_PEP_ID=MMETSP0325_2-20121206/44994_1 /ASSEMBLY_ACC=CAM_ASM_000347 /TAXON_ID=2866 /ORGANISM="Crypthecodinium cohnii, Strain Seligo" /LENGTH=165 /DNA_ID=CAMNT_0054110139 /DNA_START=87 /DNA_END=584 /DNA_ORIENTATION=-